MVTALYLSLFCSSSLSFFSYVLICFVSLFPLSKTDTFSRKSLYEFRRCGSKSSNSSCSLCILINSVQIRFCCFEGFAKNHRDTLQHTIEVDTLLLTGMPG